MCLSDIRSWMSANKLQLNDNKTEFITICAPQYRKHISVDTLSMGDITVPAVTGVMNLGVLMNQALSTDRHIQRLCHIALSQLRNIADVRHCLSRRAVESLVHAFVTSRLDYCNALLFGTSTSSLQKLQYVQNAAARLLTGTGKRRHITPVLQELHWLPLQSRIQYKLMLLTYKALHDKAPDYLKDLLSPLFTSRPLRSSNQNLLAVPRANLVNYGDRAFSVAAPKLWNALPTHIRSADSLNIFKRDLKTHLFSLAFPSSMIT